MTSYIVVRNTDGTEIREEAILSFAFKKDAYLPYTMLNARICADSQKFINAAEILFYIGEKLVHHGLIDTLTVTVSGGSNIMSLISRGFTSLLCQNQIEPGLKTGVSINNLMDSFYALPYVTHEDNSDQSSYIYVKNNSTMWDGIVNLSYKHYGTYPFIRDTNCVRMTPVSTPSEFRYDNPQLLSTGTSITGRRLVSHFHMPNLMDEYGEFELEDADVTAEKIVRHKFIELDRQFLHDPQQALIYRDKYAARGWRRLFCSYCGYNGEDLSDIISFEEVVSERIAAVEINGSSSGIVTEISVYHDKFPR